MKQFVCVRLVRAERLDLSLFEFDYDMSFAVFLMNADKTIYGRYGSRSDFIDAEREISINGLKLAMSQALIWHQRVDELRPQLLAKRRKDAEFQSFGEIPSSGKSRYSRGFGEFTGRCTHCHDVRTARQLSYRSANQSIPDREMFAWPMPDVVGMRCDPQQRATLLGVTADSPSAKAGLQPGDRIMTVDSQPVLSIADIQWVLHNADDEDRLNIEFARNGETKSTLLDLPNRWRRKTPVDWRPTTRVLRKKLFSGVEFRVASEAERNAIGVGANQLALKAYRGVSRSSPGPIRRGDIIVLLDGKRHAMNEADLLAYALQQKQAGERIAIEVMRGDQLIRSALTVGF